MRKNYPIIRTSPFSGETNTMHITLNLGDYQEWQMGNRHIQNAMPYLTADEREFIMTGITPEEWEESFGD